MACVALVAACAVVASAAVVRADGGAEHQVVQPRPVELGASGGSIDDLDGGFCCGGTLGALVEDGQGNQYILSNNHVLGRTNRAQPGEDTIQPGLIDSGCRGSANSAIADFSEYVPISFGGANRVDAALARVRPGMVDPEGAILDVGVVAATAGEPAAGMSVAKSGRTTGYTTGTIAAVAVTVSVSYPKRCGGGGGPTAVMTDQLRITPADFSSGGDSGSLVVTTETDPRAVGLLFAGSATSTLANPINAVLGAGWSVGTLVMAGATPRGCGSDADCDDSDLCTIDDCLASGSCQHTTKDCDDGDPCTIDACSQGACSHQLVSCDDGDPCTLDGCDAEGSCSVEPVPGCVDPCGDGACDIGAGETCASCPTDCNGVTTGKKASRFCCGVDVGCDDERCGSPCTPGALSAQPKARPPATVEHARDVKERSSMRLLAMDDVVGHGVAMSARRGTVIEVYLARDNPGTRARLARGIEDVPVRVRVTGPFIAY